MSDDEFEESSTTRISASPYSGGGGGTRLEHRLGAVYLARLLTRAAVSELGDRAPTLVAFQQSPNSPVDDLVITSDAEAGAAAVTVAIASRRAPTFVRSHKKTKELVAALVRADIAAEQAADEAREVRVAVAVSGYQAHAREVAELAAVARNHTDASAFFALINEPGKYATRRRLVHLTDMVAHALSVIDDSGGPSTEHRCWSLLRRLYIIEADLEPGHDSDWADLVNDLVPVSVDHTPASAIALRDELESLAGEFAQSAATVDVRVLRRRLHRYVDPTSHRPVEGWDRLVRLDHEARSAVARTLVGSGSEPGFALPRPETRAALSAAIAETGDLMVKGDSGVGKSAAVLDATEPAALGNDQQAIVINLRHLPDRPLALLAELSTPLDKLFDEMTAPARVLVIDGAEAAAEDRSDVFGHVLRGARAAGVKVVAVAATEGAGVATELMKAGGGSPREYTVPPLSDDEITAAAQHFPELQRLVDDPKGRELLRRPIVIDLLARAGDPGVPLSEVDALDHVWQQLVRNGGRGDAGSPDAREQVMLSLAAHALNKGPVDDLLARLDQAAVAGLRRSGLLRPASALPWELAPEFKHDLLRAYAVARRLLVERDPAAELALVGAPRWTLPAARLACAVLLSAPDGAGHPLAGRLARVQASFDQLLSRGAGERWADVPCEAALLVSRPGPILEDAWSGLLEHNAQGISRLIRVLQLRHQRQGFLDPVVAEPVVALVIDKGVPKGLAKEASGLLRDWLTAHVVRRTSVGDATRVALSRTIVKRCADNEREADEKEAEVRAARAARSSEEIAEDEKRRKLLAPSSIVAGSRRRRTQPARRPPYQWIDETAIAQLALLGADLGADGAAILRRVAADEPHSLSPAVETPFAGQSLADFDPSLLVDLVDAYYIEAGDEEDDDEFGFGHGGFHEDGIRDHTYGGLGTPMAAYYRGPFIALFRADYIAGVACLNRMLNHAARYRVRIISNLGYGPPTDEEAEGCRHVLSVSGEPREYIGDAQVWLWYRGTGVGPYACMSALQALEFVSDELVGLGVPVTRLATILLDGAESLAMPALVLGLFVRHLESARDALDPFIVEPLVWDLEFSRAIGEKTSGLAARTPLKNLDRRAWSLRETCMMLMLHAEGDRIDQLRRLGERLISKAAEDIGADDSRGAREHLAAVRSWAASLDRAAYEVKEQDGQLMIQQAANPEVEAVLGATNADLRRGNEAAGLTVRHAHVRDNGGRAPSIASEDLAADLATARDLVERPPETGFAGTSPDGPIAAAASAIELHFDGRNEVARGDLEWSATVLLDVATAIEAHPSDVLDDSLFGQGPDRSAGRALPYLLLPAAAELRRWLGFDSDEGTERLVALSSAVATRASNEARLAYARGLDAVWPAPCSASLNGRCHHRVALDLVEASFEDCVLGPWDNARQRVTIDRLDPPTAASLATRGGKELIVRRLTAALRATGAAAISGACCRDDAREALDVLLAAHRRGMLASKHGHHHSHSDALVAARAALWQSTDGRDEPLLQHVDGYLSNSRLLAEALKAINVAADERAASADHARRLWPVIMDRVLEAAEANPQLFADRHWGNYAESELIPNPSSAWGYLTIELVGDAHHWRDLLAWSRQVERWLEAVSGDRMNIDSLVIAVRELDVADQVDVGLKWIERVVERSGPACANTFTLPEWLHERRQDLANVDEVSRWQRVVDRLVVAGDTRVADLAD